MEDSEMVEFGFYIGQLRKMIKILGLTKMNHCIDEKTSIKASGQ